MPTKSLPASPSLDHLKNQAKDLQKAFQDREAQAIQRVKEFHPKSTTFDIKIGLSDAQLVIAREYRYASWTKLREGVENGSHQRTDLPHHERIQDPEFREAVRLLDAGEESGLKKLLDHHPSLVRQRVYFDAGGYFGSPSLLEFVAENPIRHDRLPPNIVDIARIIINAGADPRSIDETLVLVASGKVAREEKAQIPLIDLLCDHHASPDAAMSAALFHGEFGAVEALLRRGAKSNLETATALGRLDLFDSLIASSTGEERQGAVALAAQFGRKEILTRLIAFGERVDRFNPIGRHSHSTPLHQAALAGNLAIVRLLVDAGASLETKDIVYQATPLDWAVHENRTEVADYLRERTKEN